MQAASSAKAAALLRRRYRDDGAVAEGSERVWLIHRKGGHRKIAALFLVFADC